MKLKYIKKSDLFICPEYAKDPGLFHVIEPDDFIGWRDGLIVERNATGIHAINILLAAKGSEKREFTFDLGRQRGFDFPVYWLLVSYLYPKSICWPTNWRLLRSSNFLGKLESRCGIKAMQHS